MSDDTTGTAPRRRHRHRRDHRPGRHARRVLGRRERGPVGDPAGAAPPDGGIPDDARRRGGRARGPGARVPAPGRLPRARDRLRAEGGRGGRRALRRPSRRRDRPGALGRRRRHLQRGPARRRASGTSAGSTARSPTRSSSCSRRRRRSPRRSRARSTSAGPCLSVNTACAASANAIGLRRRADPHRPGRRRPHRRRGRALGRPLLGLQLPRVAVAGAGGAVLARPPGSLARRGQRDAGAHARGPGPRARRARPGRDRRLRPVRRRLPPDRAAPRGRGRRARDPGRAHGRRGGARRGRLRQQPRHRDGEERPGRDRSDEASASATTPTTPPSAAPSR